MPPERRRRARVLVQDTSHHVYGNINNTTNVNNGPATTIQYANNVNLVAHEDMVALDSLPKHPDTSSQWNDYLEYSRDGDLAKIWRWIDDSQQKELMKWIFGTAGAGKSTLARRLKEELHARRRLACSIFLSQLTTDTWGPETIIRLIGAEIGRTHRAAIPAVAEAVRQCHGASLEVHVDKFMREPLQTLQLPHPLIVVMDAVDEWRAHYQFIQVLRHLSSFSSLIRFIILGRSEPRAQRFPEISMRCYHLLPVSLEIMQRYLEKRFATLEWPFQRKPGDQEILKLAKKANGLFIWVATACSLLERPRTNPHDTLEAILLERQSVGDSEELAQLYFHAIDLLFPRAEDKDAARELLGYTLVLQEALPLEVFVTLSGIGRDAVMSLMSDLRVLQVRQPVDSRLMVNPAKMVFHASFVEYLRSTSIPSEIAFAISLSAFHLRIGKACLGAMTRMPPAPRDANLTPATTYPVLFWPLHVAAGIPPVKPDFSQLEEGQTGGSTSILQWVRPDIPGMEALEALENVLTFEHLVMWSGLYVRLLQPDQDPYVPITNSVGALMRGVAKSMEVTGTRALAYKIPCLEIAVWVAPRDAEGWLELGVAFGVIAHIVDLPDPVYKAVVACEHAVTTSQMSRREDGGHYVRALAVSLHTRHIRTGDLGDLERCLSLERDLIRQTPPGHADRSTLFHNLAISLDSRFNRLGYLEDLEEAILLHREALSLRPSGNSDRSLSLNNLASSLHSHFKHLGSLEDLEEAIILYREALSLRPSGNPYRSSSLNNLAYSLDSRFNRLGSLNDVEEAILLHREALSLRPLGNPDRSSSLNNLASSLYLCFDCLGSFQDLEEAILLHREALSLRPSGNPYRSLSLNNLAYSLNSRFNRMGSLEDLEEAILLHREALSLRPLGNPDRSSSLNNLASSLTSRFNCLGSLEDLEEAVLLHREALSLRPLGNPDRSSSLNNLASSLTSRFNRLGSLEDLEEAIRIGHEALSLCPTMSPRRSTFLWNLLLDIHTQLNLRTTIESLCEAITLSKEALPLFPPDGADYATLRANLSFYVEELAKYSTGN